MYLVFLVDDVFCYCCSNSNTYKHSFQADIHLQYLLQITILYSFLKLYNVNIWT